MPFRLSVPLLSSPSLFPAPRTLTLESSHASTLCYRRWSLYASRARGTLALWPPVGSAGFAPPCASTATAATEDSGSRKHALAWILSNRGMKIDDFVHDYYSVARFRAAYEDRVEPMPDRSQWPKIDLGYKVYPPLLGRAAGRPKVQRQRGWQEQNPNKKKVRCKRCGGFGHFSKTCKREMAEEDGETATTNKRKRTYCNLEEAVSSKGKKRRHQRRRKLLRRRRRSRRGMLLLLHQRSSEA